MMANMARIAVAIVGNNSEAVLGEQAVLRIEAVSVKDPPLLHSEGFS